MEFAGIQFDWHSRSKGGFPTRVTLKKGNTAIIYFGKARKGGDPKVG